MPSRFVILSADRWKTKSRGKLKPNPIGQEVRSPGKPKLNAEQIKALTKIISDCKEANNDRNSIIHGKWIADNDEFESMLETKTEDDFLKTARAIKRRLRSEDLVFPAGKIEAAALKLAKVTNDLREFALDNQLSSV